MEYLYIIIGVLIVFFIDYNRRRNKKQDLINRIRSQWGTPAKRQYSWEELEHIAYRFRQSEGEDSLDDITWHDLDMDRIFFVMNQTCSSAGQEYLYRILRTPLTDLEELKQRDDFMNRISEDESGREQLQILLAQVGKCRSGSLAEYMALISDTSAESNLRHYLMIAAFAGALLILLFVHSGVGMIVFFAVLGYNIVDYYRCKARIEPYFICIKSVAAMSKCCKKISQLAADYLERDRMAEYGRLFEKESRKLQFLSSGADYNGSLLDTLMDYVRMITHIDIIFYNQIVGSFQKKQERIDEMIDRVGWMDALTAVASYRCMLEQYTRPVFSESVGNRVKAVDIYHPLIENPVKNSISAENSVLLTGSNASGKSTFLRTMAVNAVFAQTIFTCTAASYESNFFRIYSSMSLQDDLLAGDSYYMVEIKAIKRILEKCGDGIAVLCFVDEVLRGTNTVERIAASTSILRCLKTRNALCFAATHDIELTKLLEGEYRNYHFEETVTDEDISFNYCLQTGPAVTRNAIKLLKMMDYDNEIIVHSERMAKEFLESGIWVLP